MTELRALALLAASLVSIAPSAVHAHALESLRDVAFHPTDASALVVSYAEGGGGLLISRDHGRSFQLLCTSAITGRPESNAAPPLVLLSGDGHLLVGTFRGLFRDDGHGCNFQRVPELADGYVWQLVNDPDDPAVVYALTASGGGASNAALRSRDNGASWSPISPPEPAFFQNLRIEKQADGTRRMLLSVCKPATATTVEACELRSSLDEGMTFSVLALPPELSLTVLGTDVVNPMRLYAVGDGPVVVSALALFINDSAGAPSEWKTAAKLSELGTFLLPKEGGLWLADPSERTLLHVLPGAAIGSRDVAGASSFVRNPLTGEYLLARGFTMTQASASAAAEGPVVLDMNSVAQLVTCGPGNDVGRLCSEQLVVGWCEVSHFPAAPFCAPLLAPAASDAAPAPSAPVDAGLAAAPAEPSGCRVQPGDTGWPGSALLLVLAALAVRPRARLAAIRGA
ncbi:MAG TPA: hypothetical protein VFX59_00345, partial [Polyangiales bacterium]|nr:hypothetical protein [Polyangiales bacterium]